MKSRLLLSGVLGAATLMAQTKPSPAVPSQPPASSSTNQLRVRGPEAVSQQDPTRVVATIDGKPITAKEAAHLLQMVPADQRKRYENQLPNVLQQLYMSEQIASLATKMNLDQQSPWKDELQLSRNQILTQAYLNKMAGSSSGPAQDPQQYYNAHPQEFDRAKLSGIFVSVNPPGTPASAAASNRTEDQARQKATDIEKKLKDGGDFSTLARTESDNQQAAARGGDIGTYSVGDPQLPADLRTAIEKLQPGQVSEPVRLPNAFLIVKLESRSKLTFEQARAEILQKQQTERSQAAVKQEVDKYKIQVQDPDFFNAGATSSFKIPSLQRPGSPVGQPSTAPTKP